MKYIFWQNILSIHQAPFLESLSQINDVSLIVEQPIEEIRIKDGWDIPDFGNTKIIISPSLDEIKHIILHSDAIHVFSGINLGAYKLLQQAFNMAVAQNAKIGIMSEPFDWLGLKGRLRYLKYLYLKMKYERKISFILAIGDRGRWCYEQVGFSKNKIFDWGYFTKKENETDVLKVDVVSDKPSLLYIGRLNKEKGITPLIEILLKYQQKFHEFNIIGDGICMNEVQELLKGSVNCKSLGNIKNDDVYRYLKNADVCILPSIGKDGWGAVVNEALMCGTPVIASNYCGASMLLDDKDRGEVFRIEENNLEAILKRWIDKGKVSDEQRRKIKEWADKNISGEVSSRYFLEIMSSVFEKEERPVAPWLKEK